MRYFYSTLLCLSTVVQLNSQSLLYAFTNEGTGTVDCNSSNVDITGATVITGRTGPGNDFDPSGGYVTCNSGIYVARYFAGGQLHWIFSLPYDNSLEGVPLSITTDKDGNIFLAGYIEDTLDLNPDSLASYNVSNANPTYENIFIASYDSTGNFRWGHSVSAPGTQSWARAVGVDSTGNVYVTGFFNGINQNMDFDPGAGTENLFAEPTDQVFLASYTNTGNFRWVLKTRGANSCYILASALDVDRYGNCYIGGDMEGSCDFNPTASNFILVTNQGGTRVQPFIAKYDSSGNFRWAFTMNCVATGAFNSNVTDLCLSPDEKKLAVTGTLGDGQYDFAPSGVFYVQGANSTAGYAASYDTSLSLNCAWSIMNAAGSSYCWPGGIDFDATGNIVYAGTVYSGTYDFDPGPGVAQLVASSPCIGFVSRHDSVGNFIQVFGVDYGIFNNLIIDSITNAITVTGEFDASGTTDMDPGPQQYILAPSFNIAYAVARYNSGLWVITSDPVNDPVEFNVYPVPATSLLNLRFESSDRRTISLYDSSGREVFGRSVSGSSVAVDISGNSPGIYLLVVNENGLLVRRVIVIQ